MKKLLMALSLLLGLALAPSAIVNLGTLTPRAVSTISTNPSSERQTLPARTDSLGSTSSTVKTIDAKKTLVLEDLNTVVLKGPVTGESVAATMRALQAASRKISKETPIYLVLDTPGGEIDAGMDLIDFAKALPQKVHTVTLFAASMGFQIAQGLDNRYIVRTGMLMSHRARVEGLGGQVNGELESRYNLMRRDIDLLDTIASNRMGIDLVSYRARVENEMWIRGYDSINEKVADEQVLVQCGPSLNGSYAQSFNTMFGAVKVTFSKCPLIKAPESIDAGQISLGERTNVENALLMSVNNETRFVRDYIVTNRFYTIFK